MDSPLVYVSLTHSEGFTNNDGEKNGGGMGDVFPSFKWGSPIRVLKSKPQIYRGGGERR